MLSLRPDPLTSPWQWENGDRDLVVMGPTHREGLVQVWQCRVSDGAVYCQACKPHRDDPGSK